MRTPVVDTPPRFVPIRRHALLPRLLEERDDDEAFAATARVLHHLLRFEASDRSETLNATYDPFDPDPLVVSEDEGDSDTFLDAADKALVGANYRRVTDDELQAAFDERSLFTLKAEVDLDEYDILRLYRRGQSERSEKVRGWNTLWRWKDRQLHLFDRLVVIMRLHPEALQGDRTMRTSGMEAGRIYLKSFKNIPTADVEMVLPNTRLRMRTLDRFLVGGPLAAGVGWTLFQSISVLAAFVAGGVALSLGDARLKALGGVLLVLAGYLWRTHGKVKTTRLQYIKTLSQGLYFRNLANNRAVLQQALESACDEEEKEALLAYHFLSRDGPKTAEQLDHQAETWILDQTGRSSDFDVHNGLALLDSLDLVHRDGDQWTAVPPAEAAQILNRRWDAAFGADDGPSGTAQA